MGEVRDIFREELKDLFKNFDGDRKDEFIKKHPEIWDDCFDIMEDSRYHRVMLSCLLAGYDSGLSKSRELVGKLKTAIEFAVAPDMWVSNGENDEWFKYKYEEWYQDTLRAALELIGGRKDGQ